MNLKVNEVRKHVLHVEFPNQYLMGATLFRLQEFYESPYAEIRSKLFSLEYAMDLYAGRSPEKTFTYFDDWSGFNIPDYSIQFFYDTFENHLLEKEKKFFSAIHKYIYQNNKYYIIGTSADADKEDMTHELSHAYFYIYKKYKLDMINLMTNYKHYTFLQKELLNMEYSQEVISDEIQAYLATNNKKNYSELFLTKRIKGGSEELYKSAAKFRKIFKSFDKERKNEVQN